MTIICPKCGHANHQPTGAADEACPSCGVIYAKARVAAHFNAQRAPRPAPRPQRPVNFIDLLRTESHYPTFRTVVSLATLFGYFLAFLLFLGAVIAWWGDKAWGLGVGGVMAAAAVAVVARVFKEMWLMLADMSDATIRMARQQEPDTRSE